MRTFATLAALLVGLAGAACSIQRAEMAKDAQRQLVGMSQEQLLSCMGPPANQSMVGSTEVWQYASGDGYRSGGGTAYIVPNTNIIVAGGASRGRSCLVNITFSSGRVQSINYQGRTGGLLTKGEQCAYAVENCVR